ncbi:MAG TPA: hypothetical protein VIK89_13565 [Cytophagaceae bacterium]
MSSNKVLSFITLLFIASLTYGQSAGKKDSIVTPEIKVIARAYNDSIILRWAANSPVAWKNCNQYGVKVERYTMYRDGKALPIGQRDKVVLAENVKPLPEAQWKPLADKSDIALVAAQAIYGSSFEVSTNGKSDMMTLVNKAQELENRYGFALLAADQSTEVATASGMRWKDSKVKQNEKYLYKIYALVPDGIKIDTGFVFIDASERFEIPRPIQLKAEFDDRIVKLSWNRVYFENIFTGYRIERSDDGGKTFQTINKSIYLNVIPEGQDPTLNYRIDSLPENNKNYMFRIKGITPFGEISPASDIVQGTGKEKPKFANANIYEVENVKNTALVVKWRFPVEDENKIKGFKVFRAKSTDSLFKEITPTLLVTNVREYKDTRPGKVNYYQIKVIDHFGNAISSFPAFGQLIDSIPPASPVSIKGTIDSNGVVTLKWKKGIEEDLYGYRVYRANSLSEEFSQVTKATLRDTVFIDTVEVKTLTKKVYYKVMALDENYNASKLSKVVEIKRPDKFPPAPPRFTNVISSDTGIYIQWNHSPSYDVVRELLYRKEEKSKEWKLIAISDSTNKINSYTDKQLEKGKAYQYTLIAVDDSKLESEPENPITGKMIETYVRPAITKIQPSVDRITQQIQIKWEYKEQGVQLFQIYRAENDEPFRLYKTVSKDSFMLTDKTIKINSKYKYMVRASFTDGAYSAMSKEIVIEY